MEEERNLNLNLNLDSNLNFSQHSVKLKLKEMLILIERLKSFQKESSEEKIESFETLKTSLNDLHSSLCNDSGFMAWKAKYHRNQRKKKWLKRKKHSLKRKTEKEKKKQLILNQIIDAWQISQSQENEKEKLELKKIQEEENKTPLKKNRNKKKNLGWIHALIQLERLRQHRFEKLSHEQQKHLVSVSLKQVISKWLGEGEDMRPLKEKFHKESMEHQLFNAPFQDIQYVDEFEEEQFDNPFLPENKLDSIEKFYNQANESITKLLNIR